MVKKLYTADDSDNDDDNKKEGDKEGDPIDEKSPNMELADEISKRKVFSYGTGRWYFMHRMSSPFCCCCRPRNRKDDILFKDAKQKLYEEIDLLEIVKKLRVNQFASDVVLKPKQRDLVNFFLTYKL